MIIVLLSFELIREINAKWATKAVCVLKILKPRQLLQLKARKESGYF
jgi:hypothetical protein